MRKKFFFRRFIQYLGTIFLPVLLLLTIMIGIEIATALGDMSRRARNMAASVNATVDLTLSNIMIQNGQFANNPYMILSLKRILHTERDLDYQAAINIRSINATLKSIITTYPYVKSVYLALDEYKNYYTSKQRIAVRGENEEWWNAYEAMDREQTTLATVLPSDKDEQQKGRVLTLFQRMPFYRGVVVMRIDLDAYGRLLANTVDRGKSSVIFQNQNGQTIFVWGDENAVKLRHRSAQFHQENNEDYQLRIIAVTPKSAAWDYAIPYLPFLILLLMVDLISVFLTAYYTTKRNFSYIDNMIDVLDHAERGVELPQREGVKGRWREDEYSVVLNNIIRLHLQATRLNAELEERQHAQELTSLIALQTQINPHFLFNTLQNIALEAKGGHGDAAFEMTTQLAEIMKYALSDPMETVTLREEITYLKEYVAIQRARFGNLFIIYYMVEEEDLYDTPVFRLMLQPIIENSILHGIRPSGQKGYIKLRVYKRKEYVCFLIMDTGVGIAGKRLSEVIENIRRVNVHSIGLANVNARLKLYYGESAELCIHSREGSGTAVFFRIPEHAVLKRSTQNKNEVPFFRKS
ncbi:MAG: sensor histidine kinase [Oribacterium sp.]